MADTEIPSYFPNPNPTLDAVQENRAKVAEIDVHLGNVAGTVVAKRNAAVTANELLASNLSGDIKADKKVIACLDYVYAAAETLAETHPLIAVAFLDDVSSDIDDLKAKFTADSDGIVSASLRATGANSETTTTLIEQRSVIVGLISAMTVYLDQMGLLDLPLVTTDRDGNEIPVTDKDGSSLTYRAYVAVPAMPKVPGIADTATKVKRTVSGTDTAKVVSKVGRHYVIKADGTKHFHSNPDLSYLGYKFGVTTADMETIVKAAGIRDFTKSWEITADITGVKAPRIGKTGKWTFGFDVSAVSATNKR